MKNAKWCRTHAQQQLKGNYGACIYISILKSALTSFLFLIPCSGILFGGALNVGLLTPSISMSHAVEKQISSIFLIPSPVILQMSL